MIRRYNKKRGFTLVELMIAATIIIVALATLLATYFVSFDANEMARYRIQASNDAKAVLEQMRNVVQVGNLSDVTSQNWTNWSLQNIIQNQNHPMVGDANSETITVSYADASADPLEVTVRVNWTVKNGRPQSLMLVTLMTKR